MGRVELSELSGASGIPLQPRAPYRDDHVLPYVGCHSWRSIHTPRGMNIQPITERLSGNIGETRSGLRAAAAESSDLGGTGIVGLEFRHFAEALGEAFQ